jgi:hypothetical protein
MPSFLDEYRAAVARFEAAHPGHAEAMRSRCECDRCDARRDEAQAAFRRWLRDEGETDPATAGGAR